MEEWSYIFFGRRRRKRRTRKIRRLEKRLRARYAPKSFVVSYTGLIFVGLAFVALTFIGLLSLVGGVVFTSAFPFIRLPIEAASKGQAGTPAFRLDVAKTALTVTAGLGAVGALLVGYRKQRADEVAQLREQDKLHTERFMAASIQLGNEKAAVRLAGAYAIFRVADDSDRDRDMCLNTLAGYLRMARPNETSIQETTEDSAVREAILDGITQRISVGNYRSPWVNGMLDLSGTTLPYLYLRGVQLDRTAYFSQTTFEDEVKITNLECPEAFFRDCVFRGAVEVHLEHSYAKLDFTGATFLNDFIYKSNFRSIGVLSLKDVVFKGRCIVVIEDANYATIDLTGADFTTIEEWLDGVSVLIKGNLDRVRLDKVKLPADATLVEQKVEDLGKVILLRPATTEAGTE